MDETTMVESYKSSRIIWKDEIGLGGKLLETLHYQKSPPESPSGDLLFLWSQLWIPRQIDYTGESAPNI